MTTVLIFLKTAQKMKHDCMRKQMIFLHDGEIVNINNSGIGL